MESGTKDFFESIFNCKRDFGNKGDYQRNNHVFQVKKFNFKIMIISIIIVILVENSSSFINLTIIILQIWKKCFLIVMV